VSLRIVEGRTSSRPLLVSVLAVLLALIRATVGAAASPAALDPDVSETAGLDGQVDDPLTAQFIYPQNGITKLDVTRSFEWTPVPNAQAYVLQIGTAAGTKDILETPLLQQTSYAVTVPLPLNRYLYARIWTKVGNIWRVTDASGQIVEVMFSVVPPSTATFVYPLDLSTQVDLTRGFEWTPVEGSQGYAVYIGTSPGAKDVLDSGLITASSYKPATLPTDRVLYARLWTKAGGVWKAADWNNKLSDISFTVVPQPLVPSLVYPVNGTKVTRKRVFQWSSVAFAQSYYLYVGTSYSARDLVYAGPLTEPTYTVDTTNWPTDRPLFVLVWTKVGGVWRAADAAGNVVSASFTYASLPPTTSFEHPANGERILNTSDGFRWTDVDAQAYDLYIGTTPGARDVFDSGVISNTSLSLPPLPLGRTLHARLWTKVDGVWRAFNAAGHGVDITFMVTGASTLVYPGDGESAADLARPASWTPVGADGYRLLFGSAPGANDLFDSGEIPATSLDASAVAQRLNSAAVEWAAAPDDDFLVHGFALTIDGEQTDVGFVPVSHSCAEGLTVCRRVALPPLSPSTHTISVTAYNPNGEATTTVVAGEPSREVFARLWTRVGNAWLYNDTRFIPDDLAARFIYPAQSWTLIDLNKPLRWTSIPRAEMYSLQVGSAPGLSDLLNVSELTGSSYQATSLPGHRLLFGRLGTRIEGVWRYSETSFFAMPLVSELLRPAPGRTGVDPATWFIWSSVAAASAYRLEVGTSLGAFDVIKTEESLETMYVPVVPLTAATKYYVRLWTKALNEWRYVDSTFETSVPEVPRALAALIEPETSTVSGPSIRFTWNIIPEAIGYHLHVGSSPGADNFGMSPDYMTQSEFTVTLPSSEALPPGGKIFVTLYTQYAIGDWSHFVVRELTVAPPAPPDGN
jgi:hypothetical protein